MRLLPLLFCSSPKDMYYDHDLAESDRKKEEGVQKKPQQSESLYFLFLLKFLTPVSTSSVPFPLPSHSPHPHSLRLSPFPSPPPVR